MSNSATAHAFLQACGNHLDAEQFLKDIGSAYATFLTNFTLSKREDVPENILLGLNFLEHAEALSEANLVQFCLLPQFFSPSKGSIKQVMQPHALSRSTPDSCGLTTEFPM